MARGAATVVVNIIGKADELKKSLDKADKDLGGFSNKLDTFGKKTMATGAKFTAGLTLPIVAGLGMATKAAAEDEAAQAKLAKTLQNTVGASKQVVASVENYIAKAMKASTFTDDELRPAFENLVRETKNVAEANKLMGLAMDVAASKGISVEAASMMLVKASNGQAKALKDLGIETKTQAVDLGAVASATEKFELAQLALTVAVEKHGPTSHEAEKATLNLESAQRKLEGAQSGTVEVTRSMDQLMKDLSVTVGGAASAATETAAGKTKILERDMGELVETLGVALVPIMEKVVGWVQALTDKFTGLSPEMQTAVVVIGLAAAAIGPLITVVGALTTAVHGLNTAIKANPLVALAAAFTAVYVISEKVTGGFDGIKGHALSLNQTIDNLKRDVDNLIDTFQEFTSLGMGGGSGGGSWFTGSPLKKLPVVGDWFKAAGGPVAAGSPYIVGERGPELFVPGQSGTILPNGAGVGGGTTVNVTVNGALDENAVARQILNMLLQFQRRTGSLGLS